MKTAPFEKNYYEAPRIDIFSLAMKGGFLEDWAPSGVTTSDYDPDVENPDDDWEN